MEFTLKRKTIVKNVRLFLSWADLYVAIGLILFTLLGYFVVLPKFTPVPQAENLDLVEKHIDEYPTRISLYQVTDNLEVIPGDFHNDTWDLATDSALFLKPAGQIGKNGNIVIYGHNTNPIFGSLWKAKKDQVIVIFTNTNNYYLYRIDSIKTVIPTDISILRQPLNEQRITIFTCTGLYDSERLVVSGTKIF